MNLFDPVRQTLMRQSVIPFFKILVSDFIKVIRNLNINMQTMSIVCKFLRHENSIEVLFLVVFKIKTTTQTLSLNVQIV